MNILSLSSGIINLFLSFGPEIQGVTILGTFCIVCIYSAEQREFGPDYKTKNCQLVLWEEMILLFHFQEQNPT